MQKINKYILTFFIFLIQGSLFAQIKTDVSFLTPQETHYLTAAKTLYKDFKKAVKSFKKDSVKVHRKLSKELKNKGEQELQQHLNKADSLKEVYNLDEYASQLSEYKQRMKEVKEADSVYIASKARSYGKQFGEAELKKHEEYKEYLKFTKEYKKYSKEYDKYLKKLDKYKHYLKHKDELIEDKKKELLGMGEQIAQNRLKKLDEVKEFQKQTAELEKIKEIPAEYQKHFAEYQRRLEDKDAARREAMQKAVGQIRKHFQQYENKVSEAATNFQELKKKYSFVPNSNDLSTARKINSLKNKPLKKRLKLGGTLQLVRGTPTAIDFSPTLGYRLDKRLSIHTGGTYRATVNITNEHITVPDTQQEVYGYKGFAEYRFFKNFHLHLEYENLNTEIFDANKDVIGRTWEWGALAGISKEYSLRKSIKGSVQLLYNFHHTELSPYPRPWMIRVGFMPTFEKVEKPAFAGGSHLH